MASIPIGAFTAVKQDQSELLSPRDEAFEGVLRALAIIRTLDPRSDGDVWVPLLQALADGGHHAEALIQLR